MSNSTDPFCGPDRIYCAEHCKALRWEKCDAKKPLWDPWVRQCSNVTYAGCPECTYCAEGCQIGESMRCGKDTPFWDSWQRKCVICPRAANHDSRWWFGLPEWYAGYYARYVYNWTGYTHSQQRWVVNQHMNCYRGIEWGKLGGPTGGASRELGTKSKVTVTGCEQFCLDTDGCTCFVYFNLHGGHCYLRDMCAGFRVSGFSDDFGKCELGVMSSDDESFYFDTYVLEGH